MENREYDRIASYLTGDEYVVWKGAPVKGHLFTPQDIFMIPFSLMWGGFAVFWELSVIAMDAPLLFKIWGIPFVAVGLYMIAGRFFVQAYRKKHTYYAITSKRILRIRKNQMDSLNYRLCPERRVSVNRDGSGTILFGNAGPQPVRGYQMMPGQSGRAGFAMEQIPEVNRVMQILAEQESDRISGTDSDQKQYTMQDGRTL